MADFTMTTYSSPTADTWDRAGFLWVSDSGSAEGYCQVQWSHSDYDPYDVSSVSDVFDSVDDILEDAEDWFDDSSADGSSWAEDDYLFFWTTYSEWSSISSANATTTISTEETSLQLGNLGWA